MTMIALIEVNNVAMLLGDVLVSWPHPSEVLLPTVGMLKSSFIPGPIQSYPTDVCQKVVRINDHLVVAWSGTKIVAQSVVRELREMAAEHVLSWKEIDDYVQARREEDSMFRNELCLMGLFNCGDGLHTFAHGKFMEVHHEHAQKVLVAGSGIGHMRVGANGEATPVIAEAIWSGLTSGGRKLKDNAPGLIGVMLQGVLLQLELTEASTLEHSYGGAYEMAYFERTWVKKSDDIVHVYSTYDLSQIEHETEVRPNPPFRFSRILYAGSTCFVVNADPPPPEGGELSVRVHAIRDLLDGDGQTSVADASLLDLSRVFAQQEFTCWNLIVLSNQRVVRLVPLCASKPTGRNGELYTEHEDGLISLSCSDQLRKQVAATLRQERDALVASWMTEANALHRQGDELGDNDALRDAINAYESALRECSRAREPLRWATIQNSLGAALMILGQRQDKTELLVRAVTAYRESLEERTRDLAPLDWAATQNNLGNALWGLGLHEIGTTRFNEAVEAHRDALREFSSEREPRRWAITQNNLGTVLVSLGERTLDSNCLEMATAACREALTAQVRLRAPVEWAMTQSNLGNAYRLLGELTADIGLLEQAVASYREALKEYRRDRLPLYWAMTQNRLGVALMSLGKRENGNELLEQAVVALRLALEELTRERAPLDWAATQVNLGASLAVLGSREESVERLERAVAANREALEIYARDRAPLQWAGVQSKLGKALWHLGDLTNSTEQFEKAAIACREALKVRTRERMPNDWAGDQNSLGNALRSLGEREKNTRRLRQAVAAYRNALMEQTPGQPGIQANLGAALCLLGDREKKTVWFEQALVAYREALNGYNPSGPDRLNWASAKTCLGLALLGLGRGGDARAAFREVLDVLEGTIAPDHKAVVAAHLGLQLAESRGRGPLRS